MSFKCRMLANTFAQGALLAALSFASSLCAEPFKMVAAPSGMIYAPLIERLLSEAGFTMELSEYPAERALQMTLKGKVDGEYFRQPGAVESIRDQVLLIGPMTCIELASFVRTDSLIDIANAKYLSNFRVIAALGNKQAEQVSAQYQPQRTLIRTTEQMMSMLMAKHADVAIDSERIGLMAINTLGLQGQIQRTGPLLSSTPSYLVLRRHLQEWGPRLQKAFARMDASGEWQQMYADISAGQGLPRTVSQSCLHK
jgi:ABC-type amino acid transport substrate-binding protein